MRRLVQESSRSQLPKRFDTTKIVRISEMTRLLDLWIRETCLPT
jgi:hypothetical protein